MLSGKKILIAGAAGLLGGRLVSRLLEEGASVVAADVNFQLLGERLSSAGLAWHDRLAMTELNLNDPLAVAAFFDAEQGLDGAVNCAYPRNKQYGRHFYDVELSDFNENISLHLGASFLFIQKCAAYFERNKTPFSLVNISSVYGVIAPKFEVYDKTPMSMPVEYAAIKSALIHLSKYVAAYVNHSDFRSNCVSPGGLFDHQNERFVERYKDNCFGKGMLDVDDVLGSIVFLLSDQSRYMNGQNLIVDDGFSL